MRYFPFNQVLNPIRAIAILALVTGLQSNLAGAEVVSLQEAESLVQVDTTNARVALEVNLALVTDDGREIEVELGENLPLGEEKVLGEFGDYIFKARVNAGSRPRELVVRFYLYYKDSAGLGFGFRTSRGSSEEVSREWGTPTGIHLKALTLGFSIK